MARKKKIRKNFSVPSNSLKTFSFTEVVNSSQSDEELYPIPKTPSEWKKAVSFFIENGNFNNLEEFYTYLYIRLNHPEASEFLLSLGSNLYSRYVDNSLDDNGILRLWRYMEKLNSYLMYRNGYLTDPFFINDSKEFCRDKPFNEVTDLVVALNQPSAGAAYKSSSDELLFWNHVFGETETHELSETYDDYLDKLTEYFYCQNNQLLTLPSMVHPSVYLDTLTASLETLNDVNEDDDVISISSPLPALSVLSSSSSLPVFSFCAVPSSIVPVISAIVPVISPCSSDLSSALHLPGFLCFLLVQLI